MDTCFRCDSTKNLEKNHIIPKSQGGSDDPSNKRIACKACHDYRHTRDNIVSEINKQLNRAGTLKFNAARLSMWIFRLGILEAFNTPEKIKKRGTYIPYWDFPETHYDKWYPHIKLSQKHMREAEGIMVLTDFIKASK